jgi:hypothetical protein
MRPMTLLASVVFPSLVLAAVQVACSSDNSSNPTPTPFDSGAIAVPEASVGAGPVTIIVKGKGTVVSDEAKPTATGYAGPDGAAPVVNCTSAGGACTAPQGIVLYALPQAGSTGVTPAVPSWVFSGWSVAGGEGGATIANDTNLTITPGVGSPVTATFDLTSSGAQPPPPPVTDAGGAG